MEVVEPWMGLFKSHALFYQTATETAKINIKLKIIKLSFAESLLDHFKISAI